MDTDISLYKNDMDIWYGKYYYTNISILNLINIAWTKLYQIYYIYIYIIIIFSWWKSPKMVRYMVGMPSILAIELNISQLDAICR